MFSFIFSTLTLFSACLSWHQHYQHSWCAGRKTISVYETVKKQHKNFLRTSKVFGRLDYLSNTKGWIVPRLHSPHLALCVCGIIWFAFDFFLIKGRACMNIWCVYDRFHVHEVHLLLLKNSMQLIHSCLL